MTFGTQLMSIFMIHKLQLNDVGGFVIDAVADGCDPVNCHHRQPSKVLCVMFIFMINESAVKTLCGISKIYWSLGRKPKDIVGTVCRKVFVGFVG